MTTDPYFVTIDDQLHGVINSEQQQHGSNAYVFYPMSTGRCEIYEKLKAKGWDDEAIHERIFPRSHIFGKWTPFCSDQQPIRHEWTISQLMTWSKSELVTAISSCVGSNLPTLQHMGKRDLAVLLQHLEQLGAYQHAECA